MKEFLKVLVQDFSWVHLSLGLFGNTAFFVGSFLFLPALEPYKTLGVWLFIVGALFMAIGSLGRLLLDIWDSEARPSKSASREQARRRLRNAR